MMKYIKLFVLILILVKSPVKTYSKYSSSIPLTSGTQIASFVFLLDSNTEIPIELDENLYPGCTKEFNFNVKNFNASESSEVNLNYTLKINRTNNLPIELKLYKNDNLVLSGNEKELQNNYLEKDVNTTDSYKLVITWDYNLKDSKYAGMIDTISINIIAEQQD